MMALMERIDLAKRLANDTGAFLRSSFRKTHKRRLKHDGTLVTEFDEEAENRILRAVREAFPDDAILAEESGRQDRKEGASGVTWYVDPIDGTVNFSRGIPIFASSIAFGDDSGMLGGAIALPMLDSILVGKRGGGVVWNGERLAVAPYRDFSQALYLFSYSTRRDQNGAVQALIARCAHRRVFGSAVFSICLVAAGAAEGYAAFHLCPWDYAAGMLFIAEAGGVVVSTNGSPISVPNEPDIFAGSRESVAALVERFRFHEARP